MNPAAARRFWEKVDRGPGCWLWQRACDRDGYGVFWLGGRNHRAHRAAWMLANGPIPAGTIARHRCDRPGCVRPSHIQLGTHAENIADKVRRNRQAKGEGHGCAKLTAEQVREIRAASGLYRDIGRRFDVSESTVGLIKRGRIWRCVSEPPVQLSFRFEQAKVAQQTEAR